MSLHPEPAINNLCTVALSVLCASLTACEHFSLSQTHIRADLLKLNSIGLSLKPTFLDPVWCVDRAPVLVCSCAPPSGPDATVHINLLPAGREGEVLVNESQTGV